jgi:hypothetical protein
MKYTIFLVAVFHFLSLNAQQAADSTNNNLPAYRPVKIDGLKKTKPAAWEIKSETINPSYSFKLTNPEKSEFNFKPLQNYLSQDISYFQIEQKKKEWAQFANSSLSSWSRQNWTMNKNNVQQRWMMQKIKGK